MSHLLRPLLLVAVATVGLSACGGGGNSTPTTPPVVPPVVVPVPKIEDQFGSCFATRFRADANTKATDPVPCPDLPPLSLTSKALAI